MPLEAISSVDGCYRRDDAPMANNNGNNRANVRRKEKKNEPDDSFGSSVEQSVYWSKLRFDHFSI